ncbi:MAG: hypothetical protein WKF84_00585 [Pyrinomonadaceae bacterium]
MQSPAASRSRSDVVAAAAGGGCCEPEETKRASVVEDFAERGSVVTVSSFGREAHAVENINHAPHIAVSAIVPFLKALMHARLLPEFIVPVLAFFVRIVAHFGCGFLNEEGRG